MDHPTADDLARVPLLAHLTDDIRQVLADRFEVEEFDAGRQLVTEGERATRSTCSTAGPCL
jgi:hypothetical protein